VLAGDRDDTVTLAVSTLAGFGGVNVSGGDGNDVIDASAVSASGQVANTYTGYAGNDTVIGGPVADGLDEFGTGLIGPGDPLLPADQILQVTSAGDDRLVAGGGNDRVNAIAGADNVEGGEGDDYINTVGVSSQNKPQDDGAVDSILCGGGSDTATLGPGDQVGADCELIGQFTVCPPGGPDCEGSAEVTVPGGAGSSAASAAGGGGKKVKVLGKSKKTKVKAGRSKGVTIKLKASKVKSALGKRSEVRATMDLGLDKVKGNKTVGSVKRKVRFKLKK
jgi:Ca2+-binding RTX toxin-like protein